MRSIVINEISASGEDWIELFNPTGNLVDLSGYSISDAPPNPLRRHPLTGLCIEPGSWLVLRCGKTKESSNAEIRSFRIDADGETIALFDAHGRSLDIVWVPRQRDGQTYGRLPDGYGSFHVFARPTPNATNAGPSSPSGFPDTPIVVPESMWIEEHEEITILFPRSDGDMSVHYTLDGRIPSAKDPTYTGRPIQIYAGHFGLEGSSELHVGSTILRAAVFVGGYRVSDVTNRSYLLASERPEIGSLALIVDPASYSAMCNDDTRPEVEGFLEALHHRHSFRSAVRLKLHGNSSRQVVPRADDPKQSYKLRFPSRRARLAARRWIPDRVAPLKRAIVRWDTADSFQDGRRGLYFRDQLVRDLQRAMGDFAPRGSWVGVFLNGEPRGIYNFIEPVEPSALQDFYRTFEDWDIVKDDGSIVSGDRRAFAKLRAALKCAKTDEIWTLVDQDQFMRYMILQVWAQNRDWPRDNWYAVRSRNEGGQWSFVVWDASRALGVSPRAPVDGMVNHILNTRDCVVADLFALLLENPRLKRRFVWLAKDLVGGVLRPDSVIMRATKLETRMGEDIVRREAVFHSVSPDLWSRAGEQLRAFVRKRSDDILRWAAQTPPRVDLDRAVTD